MRRGGGGGSRWNAKPNPSTRVDGFDLFAGGRQPPLHATHRSAYGATPNRLRYVELACNNSNC
jgi:hypothetical protein